MSKIFVTDREENTHELKAETGLTLMEIIRDAGLDIEAACGGCCACATCHLYICLLYTSPSPRDLSTSRMPSSA